MSGVKAWAYFDDKGEIEIRSVSTTVQAAQVNALYFLGYIAMSHASEEMVNAMFNEAAPGTIRPVVISPAVN